MILVIVLFIGSIVVNALYDLSAQGKFKKGKGLNMRETWKNKYKDGEVSKGEKFVGSTRVFTFLTDFFHFVKFIFLVIFSYIVTLALDLPYSPHTVAFSVIVVWGIVFQSVLLIVKKINKR